MMFYIPARFPESIFNNFEAFCDISLYIFIYLFITITIFITLFYFFILFFLIGIYRNEFFMFADFIDA